MIHLAIWIVSLVIVSVTGFLVLAVIGWLMGKMFDALRWSFGRLVDGPAFLGFIFLGVLIFLYVIVIYP